MRGALLAVLGVLALAACKKADKPAPPVPAAGPAVADTAIGFQHEAGFDAQGYYRPQTPIKSGPYELVHIAIGAPSDFTAWEAGKRDEVFGPILMQFDDPSGPPLATEQGEHPSVTAKVLPLSYRMGPGRVSFHGKDDKLGEISFEGVYDTVALAAARAAGNGEGKPVLTGALQIGAQHIDNVRLGYWAGD
ncbi:hypothetical protein BH11PSE2_BH11PSE2_09750 [soil metagenome]